MTDFNTDSHNAESLKPCLISEVEFIGFRKNIKYLKNQRDKTYLKLTKEETNIVHEFNGKNSLADILQKQLDTYGTKNFQKTFDLLIELNSKGFLSGDSASYIRSDLDVFQAQREVPKFLKSILGWADFTLFKLPLKFNFAILRSIARLLSSTIFLFLFSLITIASVVYWPNYQGINILQGFTLAPDTSGLFKYGSYFVSIFSIWFAFSFILSVKNLFSAYVLTSNGCEVNNPRIRFFYGLIFFNCDMDDIVKAGPQSTLHLFIARMIFPFVLMFITTITWQLLTMLPMIMLLKHVCVIISFFSVSPLLQTDLNRLLNLLREEPGGARHSVDFLKKRFLVELFNFKSKMREQNYYIIMSIIGIVWLYLFYPFFWSIIQSSLIYLAVDFMDGPVWGRLFIAVYLLLIFIPLTALLISSIMIGFFNVRSVLRSPVRRMAKLAMEISRRKVPAQEQVLRFLQQIPLFSRLNDEELKALCVHLRLKRVASKRDIIIQAEKGDTFYTIVSGKVNVIKESSTGTERVVDMLKTGDSFGETALIEDIPRTATIRTLEPTILFELGRKYFDEFVLESAGGKEKVTDMIRIGRMIINTQIFSYLNPSQINSLVLKLKEQSFEKEEVIFKQGDEGDRFYIIKEGEVLVERTEDGEVTLQKTLGKGNFFGEIALIKNIPRTATVISKDHACLLYLTKQEFYEVIKYNIFTGIQFDTVAVNRMTQLGKEVIQLC